MHTPSSARDAMMFWNRRYAHVRQTQKTQKSLLMIGNLILTLIILLYDRHLSTMHRHTVLPTPRHPVPKRMRTKPH